MAGIVEQEVLQEVVRLLPGQCLMGLMGRQLVLHNFKQDSVRASSRARRSRRNVVGYALRGQRNAFRDQGSNGSVPTTQ
jgi:hypothetical protein